MLRFAVCVALTATFAATETFAQSQSLFPSGGSRTGGSSLFPGGGSSLGGSAGGAGNSSIDTNLGTRGVNTTFNNGFVGSNTQGTGGFVGAGTQGQGVNRAGATGAGGRSGFGGGTQFGGAGQFGQNRQFGTGNQFGQQNQGGRFGNQGAGRTGSTGIPPYRTVVGFRLPRTNVAPVRTAVVARVGRLSRNLRLPSALNVQVSDGGTVVISGVVGSDRDREFAENLVRLEPGVKAIENKITVRK